ncbi:hypothetical protein ACFLV1_01170, partial [Chloroflexota bacterium]
LTPWRWHFPQRVQSSIIPETMNINIWMCQNAVEPYKEKYLGYKILVTYEMGLASMSTFDPNIKTIYDLAGKSLPLGSKGAIARSWIQLFLLGENSANILDQIKVTNSSTSESSRLLNGGLADDTQFVANGSPIGSSGSPQTLTSRNSTPLNL